jgi:hypothetical protein
VDQVIEPHEPPLFMEAFPRDRHVAKPSSRLQDRVVGGNARLDESRSFELEVSFDLLSEVLRGSPQRPMG